MIVHLIVKYLKNTNNSVEEKRNIEDLLECNSFFIVISVFKSFKSKFKFNYR